MVLSGELDPDSSRASRLDHMINVDEEAAEPERSDESFNVLVSLVFYFRVLHILIWYHFGSRDFQLDALLCCFAYCFVQKNNIPQQLLVTHNCGFGFTTDTSFFNLHPLFPPGFYSLFRG